MVKVHAYTDYLLNLLGASAVILGMASSACRPALVPIPQPERVYQVAWGRVLCAEMHVARCGVNLSKCADTYEYRCLQNVRYEGEQIR